MDRVLREQDIAKVDALTRQAFDLSGQSAVAYFPVRHHSPACAYHLKETIRLFAPDIILIEGPSDAQHLIKPIASELSQPPLCIYYSFDSKTGQDGEQEGKYRAYYPFLSYSPEYVAILEAQRLGIQARFIDLPYAAGIVNQPKQTPLQFRFGEETEYEVNQYTAALASRHGCRSFSEYWESRFELTAQQESTQDFARKLLALAYFMRAATPDSAEEQERNLQRERFMAAQIAQAAKEGGKILVVTGAFHIPGLLYPRADLTEFKPHDTDAVKAYLMPYTFQATDSRSGYAAGIPYPAYYQSVWEKICKQEPDAWGKTALSFIVKTARYARKTQVVSLPDEVNALTMAQSLAVLRGKPCPGAYELVDGVRSAFVKGDINMVATAELDFLMQMLTGLGAGKVADYGCVPPVVTQFRALCAQFRISTGTVQRQDITLDILKNPSHAKKSRFLHQMAYLSSGFCKMVSGPDYVNGQDKNLAREIWQCRYSAEVETRLTDLSVFGSTIAQICASLLSQEFALPGLTASALGKLLLSIEVMGLTDFWESYEDRIYYVLNQEQNFTSLCGLIGSLRYLAGMQKMIHGKVYFAVPILIKRAFYQAVCLLSDEKTVGEDKEEASVRSFMELYSLSLEHPDWCDMELFLDKMEDILSDGFANSRLYGACLAVRCKQGAFSMDEFCTRISAYLSGAIGQPQQAASFVCGIFLAGRDALFAGGEVLAQIDAVVAAMDAETFLTVLPNLRLAFTSFLPAELDRIGDMAAQLHGGASGGLRGLVPITQAELSLGMAVDDFAAKELGKWGICNG